MDFEGWLNNIATEKYVVFVKRLSANDTGATGGHQVGPYIPKITLGKAFPSFLPWRGIKKSYPEAWIDSHEMAPKQVVATFYESKGEGRLTGWVRGVPNSPMQNEENTGALTIFAFRLNGLEDCKVVKVWICKDLEEEEYFEREVGPVDPDAQISVIGNALWNNCLVVSSNGRAIPQEWKSKFPNGKDVVNYVHEKFMLKNKSPDYRILRYRNYEMEVFSEIEREHLMPLIKNGFDNVEDFISLSNAALNRRKSRSGKSLEYHLEKIFEQESFFDFGVQCVTEGKKKPDFLFPSCNAYRDESFPADKLRMLAVKTTLKDRWRQILNEADRIGEIHLFTLQKGVSITQFDEMKSQGVVLVVPKELLRSYPKSIQSDILTLEGFISYLRKLYS